MQQVATTHAEVVYYGRIGATPWIKIGTTNQIVARWGVMKAGGNAMRGAPPEVRAALQAGEPYTLVAVEPGGREVEALRHQQFARTRWQLGRIGAPSEWFGISGALAGHLSDLGPAPAIAEILAQPYVEPQGPRGPGRPRLGGEARTVSVTTKVSQTEFDALTREFGGTYGGLRALIDQHYAATA